MSSSGSAKKKIVKLTDGETYYDIDTHRLHIYNGLVSSPVVEYWFDENKHQCSTTSSGTTYITNIPSYVKKI
jgi:hypothetical protein